MIIKGIPVSSGIAMYNVYKHINQTIEVKDESITSVEKEIKKFHNALRISTEEIEELRNIASKTLELANLEVFTSHKLIVNDPLIITEVEEIIKKSNLNMASAYKKVIDKYISKFSSMENEYMKERTIDITDVYQRVVGKLVNQNINNHLIMTKEVILVTDDITPSLVLSINTKLVKGIILKNGGKTSHSSLMIQNLGIPLIISVGENINNLNNGDFIIVDGELGTIISSPTSNEIFDYITIQNERKKERELLTGYIHKETVTSDGFKLQLLANINSDNEVELALKNGAEGIGLFRTEFEYLESEYLPTEDQLFESYKKVLNAFPYKIVMIRTIDIGGDKIPKHIKFKKQDKLRGLALTLSNEDILKTQIKALLRSNVNGNLSIMFPMVGSLDKLTQAKQLVNKCEIELLNNGIKVNTNYRLGIMVEELEVVTNIKSFIKEVDFISIGTNDLLQSMYDIDRLSTNLQDKIYLDSKFLETIHHVIKTCNDNGISTSMCGEIASDNDMINELVKYEIGSLSLSPKKILESRYYISKISKK